MQLSSETGSAYFDLRLHQRPCFVYASRECSDETVWIFSSGCAFASRICDKYMTWPRRTVSRVRKQPIIALYFEFENELL